MPRVPQLSPVQADTSVLVPARADTSAISPELAAAPGRQLQQAGNAMIGLGSVALQALTRAQDDINTIRRIEAVNLLRQKTIELTYDPQAGYLSRKGASALKNEEGKHLVDEYGERLEQSIVEISGTLDNDAQRQEFALRAGDVMASFRAGAAEHSLRELRHHGLSVFDGAIKLSTDEAERNWLDPIKVDTALNEVRASVVRAGKLQGDSANETAGKMKIATSRVHTGVINAALQNNNPSYANLHLQKYKDDMTADDILKVNGVLTKHLDGQIAQEAVRITGEKFTSRFQPTDNERLQGIVEGLESEGRDFGKDGAPLTSPKGAMYRMQVMPATAKAPGFGIRPAADDSPAEYNRVGREYLSKMVEKYGNVPQALAAYNAGPGAVDEAMAKAKRSVELTKNDPAIKPMDWLSFMPAETRDYVRKGVDKFTTGGGQAPMPTELEFMQHAVKLLGPNPRPEQVKLTQEAAGHQYALISKSIRQREEQTLVQVQQAIIGNGGNYAGLPDDLKRLLPPGKVDDMMQFAERIRKGQAVETDWSLYYQLKTDPAVLHRTNLMALRHKLGDTEFKSLAAEQAEARSGKDQTQLRTTKDVLNQYMREAGIDPTPKDGDKSGAEKVGRIWSAFEVRVREREAAKGSKLAPDEIQKVAAQLFTKVGVSGLLWNSEKPVVMLDPSDKVAVPEADRSQIVEALRSARRPVTEENILALYKRKKGL